jgi:hypothetical protein
MSDQMRERMLDELGYCVVELIEEVGLHIDIGRYVCMIYIYICRYIGMDVYGYVAICG